MVEAYLAERRLRNVGAVPPFGKGVPRVGSVD